MRTERINLEELRKAENNIRIHTERQTKEFVRSVQMFGQIRPMVIDESNTILAGNGLYDALMAMGETSGEVLRVTGLSDKDKKKLMLADNKVFSLGMDDLTNVYEMIAEIGDLDIPGFDPDVIETILADDERDVDNMMQGYGKMDSESIQKRQEHEFNPVTQEAGPVGEDTGNHSDNSVKIQCPHCKGDIWL